VAYATQLRDALISENFDAILGTEEASWVDFKTGPYSMNGSGDIGLTEAGRWELCKDVAALANNKGGCLVLGVRTEKQPLVGMDIAVAIVPIRTSLIDIGSYRASISSGIYPPPRDVTARWYMGPSDTDLGLLLIDVPRQEDNLWPFLTRRLFDCDGNSVQGFGLPTRNGDQIDWASVESIHGHIRSAPRGALTPDTRAKTERISADELIESVVREKGWEDRPTYFLQARPTSYNGDLEGFFNEDGPANVLRNPSVLRSNGFNLTVFGAGEYGDRGLAFRGREYSYLELDRDGVFTLGVLAEPMVLGWAINDLSQRDQPIRINPAVLIELTLEFCRFVHSVLSQRLASHAVVYEVRCRNFRRFNVTLMPGLPRLHWLFQSNYEANSGDLSVSVSSGDSATVDAFKIISGVYGHFNMGSDQIPLSRNESIDEDMIRNLS
jgi:hypothetical protein